MSADLLARPTAMALAFIDAAAHPKAERHGRRSVALAADRNAGLVKERAVNAKLSKRTAEKLLREGAL